MKTILKIASVSALAFTGLTIAVPYAANAEFYVGANVGGEWMNAKRTARGDLPPQVPIVIADRKRIRPESLTGGILGGYRCFFKDKAYFLALEAYVNGDRLRHNLSIVTPGGTKLESKLKRGPAYGGAARVGFHAQGFLPYVKLAVESSRFTHAYTEFVGQTTAIVFRKTSKKTRTAFVPGVGVEKDFGKWDARLEYSLALYPSTTHQFPDNDGTIIKQSLKSPKIHSLRAVVAYHLQ